MNADIALNEIKNVLQEEFDQVTFSTWFKELEVVNEDDNTIYLLCSSPFIQQIFERRKHHERIAEIYEKITGDKKNVVVLSPLDVPEVKVKDTKTMVKNNLNPKYIFEDFVVGTNNRFAHAASVAVAEDPGRTYNPLFIYGGVGLGKTHLMQAIGHYVQEKNPDAKVLYISSENFTNDFINSIQTREQENFRERYRNVDVLLIDDIQFLINKEQTQEEFFHTFNELYNNNKQIVISSDKSPNELKILEERLRSRFEWGLNTDINPPDYETRIAILRKKAEADKREISGEVLEVIAKHIKSNIRELEGALNKIVAYASLVGREIDVELTKEALQDVINRNMPKPVDQTKIREIVCDYFNITEKEMDSSKKTKKIVYPRQIAMYLVREMTELSLPKIGEIFGNRDHSTVLHNCDKITKEIDDDINVRELIDKLRERIL